MMRILSKATALGLLDGACDFHNGKIKLAPEIVAKRAEIEQAMYKAYLFIIRCGAVDEGMIRDVVELKLQLDTLYVHWIAREKNITVEYEDGP